MLVLISGPPASGKTTLAAQLAPRLRLPLVAKDVIKESLADALGEYSLEWSRRIGGATWAVMFTLVERYLSDGASVIFEANFYPERQREWFTALGVGFVPFEVHCTADPRILRSRGTTRERHRIHHEAGDPYEIAVRTNGPLELDGNVLRLDTTDGQPFDLDDICRRIEGTV